MHNFLSIERTFSPWPATVAEQSYLKKPILSFGGKDCLIEFFTISIADIISLADVGIYAGVLPQIISILISEYWIQF